MQNCTNQLLYELIAQPHEQRPGSGCRLANQSIDVCLCVCVWFHACASQQMCVHACQCVCRSKGVRSSTTCGCLHTHSCQLVEGKYKWCEYSRALKRAVRVRAPYFGRQPIGASCQCVDGCKCQSQSEPTENRFLSFARRLPPRFSLTDLSLHISVNVSRPCFQSLSVLHLLSVLLFQNNHTVHHRWNMFLCIVEAAVLVGFL